MDGATGEKKRIILRTPNGDEFHVEEAVAMESGTICNMIEDDGTDNGILLINLNSAILSRVIDYCYKHAIDPDEEAAWPAAAEKLKYWDAEFVKVHPETLFDLIMAAKYLNIEGLLDLTCKTVADRIKWKTPDQIHNVLNILY